MSSKSRSDIEEVMPRSRVVRFNVATAISLATIGLAFSLLYTIYAAWSIWLFILGIGLAIGGEVRLRAIAKRLGKSPTGLRRHLSGSKRGWSDYLFEAIPGSTIALMGILLLPRMPLRHIWSVGSSADSAQVLIGSGIFFIVFRIVFAAIERRVFINRHTKGELFK